MSQDWARQQCRKPRKPKQPPPIPPSPPQHRVPISYTTLLYLQREARAQHINSSASNARLLAEAKIDLENEWWKIVDEAMTILNQRLTCARCGCIHNAPETMKMIVKLREEMDGADVEEIDEALIEEWKGRFEGIESVYGKEMVASWCGDDGPSAYPPNGNPQVFGTEETPVGEPPDSVTLVSHRI